MRSGVTAPGSAAKMSEEVAKKGTGGQEGPGQIGESSLIDSDSLGPLSSNEGQPSSERGGARGLTGQQGGRRILIVDDEATIADTLALIFQMRRYEVRVVYSAESAIELIAEWRPALAILDVMLPGMNGIDLAIVIKANYPACRVLLFSGHANTAMLLEEAGRKGHRFEIMAKPVYPDLMLERAAELLTMPEEPVFD